jgi:hypothetical protein
VKVASTWHCTVRPNTKELVADFGHQQKNMPFVSNMAGPTTVLPGGCARVISPSLVANGETFNQSMHHKN